MQVFRKQSSHLLLSMHYCHYDRTSDLVNVNDARKWLFTQRSRSLKNIPPTQAALIQHIKWASYQASCWNMAMTLVPELPNPEDWGWWKDDTEWHPLWTTLPEASESCRELVRCGCKKGCTYEVQMCQGCPKMYSSLFLFWRMLTIDYTFYNTLLKAKLCTYILII